MVAALAILVAIIATLQVLTIFFFSGASEPLTGHFTGSNAHGTVSFNFIISTLFCQVPLTRGWSLISLCADVLNRNITTLLAGIDYRYVMRWNQTGQQFDIYSPRAVDNPFTTMEYNTSYFINLNVPSADMNVSGLPAVDLDISMVSGWNGPGYPYIFNTSIMKYFNSTKYRYMMKWNTSAQDYMLYSPRAVDNPFTDIKMGEGQLLNSYADGVLAYRKTLLQS